MANWSNPTLTSLYTDFVAEVKNRDVDLALGLDPATTSPTNVPVNAIRWNSANSRWEKYTSGSWGTLTATYVLTSLSLTGSITFEGATDDAFETTLTVADPTADRTITLPNVSGTVVTTGDTGSITSTMIADGAVVNADISASAAIAHSKLANITAGQVLLGNASNIPTATALTGDVTIDSSGVTAIGSGAIVNADINASAAIADTKLATISTAGKVDGAALTGTIPSAVLGNSNTFVGTTSIALNRASANQGLTGISSIALPGATSGTITVTPAATAGTTAITIPATSGTLVTTGDNGTITSAMIADGTIANADVSASAAIAGTKISPDFGSQNVTTTGTSTAAGFIPSSATVPSNGLYLPAANQLGLATASTSRLVIGDSGEFWFNKSASSYTVAGVAIRSAGSVDITRASDYVLALNRLNNDGNLIEFYQDNALEGTISVSGTTVSYNGAHLSRWSQLPSDQERTEILRGTVLSNIDEMCEWGEEDNEQLNRMKVSDVEGDKNVAGVFQGWDDDDDTYTNDFYCAMTGDFIIRIGAGVTVERGDLLMSAGDGTAKPQDDDIIRSKTIAKVTSTTVSCTYDDGSYCVPCVLMAC